MESYVLGQHNYQEYTVMVPTPMNWWECFKEERMPEWYLKRYPVKRKFTRETITFDHKTLFPKSDVVLPTKMGNPVYHSHTDAPGVNPN